MAMNLLRLLGAISKGVITGQELAAVKKQREDNTMREWLQLQRQLGIDDYGRQRDVIGDERWGKEFTQRGDLATVDNALAREQFDWKKTQDLKDLAYKYAAMKSRGPGGGADGGALGGLLLKNTVIKTPTGLYRPKTQGEINYAEEHNMPVGTLDAKGMFVPNPPRIPKPDKPEDLLLHGRVELQGYDLKKKQRESDAEILQNNRTVKIKTPGTLWGSTDTVVNGMSFEEEQKYAIENETAIMVSSIADSDYQQLTDKGKKKVKREKWEIRAGE